MEVIEIKFTPHKSYASMTAPERRNHRLRAMYEQKMARWEQRKRDYEALYRERDRKAALWAALPFWKKVVKAFTEKSVDEY